MATDISIEQAKQTVQGIAKRFGVLRKELMDEVEQWKPEVRREIDQSWLDMETALSSAIKTLAGEIYGSGARFVFELLQNADDNSFSKASESGHDPFITFRIYKSCVVVECNEDGFTAHNLNAICAVGQSTKSAEYGYIGAKGIGFKSVFMVAEKVCIQSGKFSFRFEHKKHEPGIGMVRPLWFDAKEQLPSPLTRTTLHLHSEGEDLDDLKQMILTELKELKDSCLLFLKKLKKITVEVYDDEGELTESTEYSKTIVDAFRVTLNRDVMKNGEKVTMSQIYHITTQKASGIAWSSGRTKPPSNNASAAVASSADVVLAFPLTEDYLPMCTEKQQLFAFLPLRTHDYKFIIHSDFDTTASRQDIITTSKRNLNLRKWIASAFVTAVLEFCKHEKLCYEWPSFLPNNNQNRWDSFWEGLNAEIKEQLTQIEVLKSRNFQRLRRIQDVRILSTDAQLNGEPLFDDEAQDPFLSPLYTHTSREILKDYGLKNLNWFKVLDLVELDIRSTKSRMQGDSTEEWHAAAAKLFCKLLNPNSELAYRLKLIPLLPMRGGTWKCAKNSSAYFSTTGGIKIPDKLDLEIIDPTASSNPDRRALFRHLGVSEVDVQTVRASIFAAFNKSGSVPLTDTVEYLHFLYLTHPSTGASATPLGLWIFTEDTTRFWLKNGDIYLRQSKDPYSAKALLSATKFAPGLPATFTHSLYMIYIPRQPRPNHPTWERWLYDSLGVRERIRLISHDGKSLSEAFQYVLKHHPSSFLGLFESLWPHECNALIASQNLQRQIRSLPAANLCGAKDEVSLENTWFPLDNLKEVVNSYTEDTEIFPLACFPFLKMDASEMTGQADSKWQFLWRYFSVNYRENLDFLIEILRCICLVSKLTPSISLTQRIFDLYVAIATKHAVQKDSAAATKRLSGLFLSYRRILVPDTNIWAYASDCVWQGPANMHKKHSLKHLYSRTTHSEQIIYIEQLFHNILQIPAATPGDIEAELEALKSDRSSDANEILKLYEYLDNGRFSATILRAMFNNNALIMVMNQGQKHWYKTADTLWSSSTAIRGKATLETQYDDLEEFFVSKLGVKSLTLDMVYDELSQRPQTNTQGDLRVAILALSNFLRNERTSLDPQNIRDSKIFPVKYSANEPILRSAEAHFAIADRAHLEESFRGQISLLNFDLEDIHKMRPFFSWIGLEDRFLSNSVKEITSVMPNSGRPVRTPSRNLCSKAYYILRLAATFGSRRYAENASELYDLLRNTETLETDDIHVTLQLSQNGRHIPIEDSSPNVHIDDSSNTLKVYVPRRKAAQSIAFCSVLPRKLLQWLMGYAVGRVEDHADAVAISTLTSIFAYDRHVLDDVLDRQGIIQIDIANEDALGTEDSDDDDTEDSHTERADDDSATIRSQSDDETLFETIGRSQMARDSRTAFSGPLSRFSSSPPLLSAGVENAGTSDHGLFHSSIHSSTQHPAYSQRFTYMTVETDNGRYRAVLERVVTAAQAASFPSRGAFNLDSLRDALFNGAGDQTVYSFDGTNVSAGFRSESQLLRDIKVGTAGELYVFELFTALGLPEWGRDNWQSTIRRFARDHPRYSDLEPWNGRETADFVYSDEQGYLTALLIDSGYLEPGAGWEEAHPKYFLEVKSTTSQCETPFYMSNNQFTLMQSKHDSRDKSAVYMILRVFGLNGRLGMCAYLDPEQLRLDGQLLFTGQSWSIVPRD